MDVILIYYGRHAAVQFLVRKELHMTLIQQFFLLFLTLEKVENSSPNSDKARGRTIQTTEFL